MAIDRPALLALNALAGIFTALGPSTVPVVEAQQSQVLLGLLDDARTAVREAGDLPKDLRTLIMDRLYDIQWAVDHYKIHGTAGLQAALDRLQAEMVRTAQHSGGWRRKVGKVVVYACFVLGGMDDVVANIEASATIAHEISQWAEDVHDLVSPDRLELAPAENPPDLGDDEDSEVVDAEIVDEGPQ